MTDMELRKLGRRELLEVMIDQKREADEKIQESAKRLQEAEEKNTRLHELIQQLQDQVETLQTQTDSLQDDVAEKQDQNMRLQSRVDELEAELVEADRQIQGAHAEVQRAMEEQHSSEIRLNEAGSIAEAALQINHVFEDADKAAQQYLESVRLLSEREDAIVAQREQESKEKAVRLLQKTEERCREKVAETKAKCAALEEESRIKSEAYWEKVSRQMQIFVASHQELKGLLGGFNQDMQQAKARTLALLLSWLS